MRVNIDIYNQIRNISRTDQTVKIFGILVRGIINDPPPAFHASDGCCAISLLTGIFSYSLWVYRSLAARAFSSKSAAAWMLKG